MDDPYARYPSPDPARRDLPVENLQWRIPDATTPETIHRHGANDYTIIEILIEIPADKIKSISLRQEASGEILTYHPHTMWRLNYHKVKKFCEDHQIPRRYYASNRMYINMKSIYAHREASDTQQLRWEGEHEKRRENAGDFDSEDEGLNEIQERVIDEFPYYYSDDELDSYPAIKTKCRHVDSSIWSTEGSEVSSTISDNELRPDEEAEDNDEVERAYSNRFIMRPAPPPEAVGPTAPIPVLREIEVGAEPDHDTDDTAQDDASETD